MNVIYGLFDPRKPLEWENCRYIGQTIGEAEQHRKEHIYYAGMYPDRIVYKWINELLEDGVEPAVLVLEEGLALEELDPHEDQWILYGRHQGWDLTNHRKGGGSFRGRRGKKAKSPVERFWGLVIQSENPSDCWGWKNKPTTYGYGALQGKFEGVKYRELAHRLSWKIHFGDIPDGLYVCHHCDNPPCANPAHLFLGTPEDNMRDKIAKGRSNLPPPPTHCKRGHLLNEDNVWVDKKRNVRHCIECRRMRDREAYRKEREARGLIVAPKNSDRTHCPQGHEYTEENTYVDKRGGRHCKMCSKIRQSKSKETPSSN